MRSLNLLYTLIAMIFLCGCQAEKTDNGTEEDSGNANTTEAAAEPLPPLPQNIRDSLFVHCDYVDMIFYDKPISASQSEKNTVRSVVYFPSLDPATPKADCKPTGRLSYMIEGQIACEADFYFTDACKYFLFIEDGKVVYGNTMTPNAINFFQNILAQADQ